MHQAAHTHIRELEAQLSGFLIERGLSDPLRRELRPNAEGLSRRLGEVSSREVTSRETFPGQVHSPSGRSSDFSSQFFERHVSESANTDTRAAGPAEEVFRRAQSSLEDLDLRTADSESAVSPPVVTAPNATRHAPRAVVVVGSLLVGVFGVYLHARTSAASARAGSAVEAAAAARQVIEEQVPRAVSRAERAAGDARTAAARLERIAAIMAAPDARRLELLGRRAAPAALGQVLWSRSHGVFMTAAHVPPLASGVYQVWLVTSTGTLSLGFASPDAQGRITATFDIPPKLPGSVTGFLVSRESAGGSTAPTEAALLST